MDVKDYSQKVDQARDKYRQAQEELRASYDRDAENVKTTASNKVKKISKAYDEQKTKLEEQNQINNENYSSKTKQAIADRAERFRNEIKKNTEKFDNDRNQQKNDFQDKLANLSTSYKKSTEENNRYHSQALKTMADRYDKANDNYKSGFDQQIDRLDRKNKEQFASFKDEMHKEHLDQEAANQDNLENLRSSSQESKFREVSRLRNDNENLRTTFEKERNDLHEQQDSRIGDIMKVKRAENEEGQRNFNGLQENIRKKQLASDEKMKADHLAESKELKKRFNEDLRNMQHLTNQKIKGGNEVSTLKDENRQLSESYENRLTSAREDLKKLATEGTEKENKIDETYREKFKNLKMSNLEELDKREQMLTAQNNKVLSDFKDKNNTINDRYKNEVAKSKSEGEDKLSKADAKSKQQMKEQRVEFGKYINNVNDKKMEEISSIKSEFSKDKTEFIEKTRKDVSDEKHQIKESFNRQMAVKEELYERKLGEMEKQTNKIIENYEARMNQLARKSEKEMEAMKATEEARRIKEGQAIQIAFDNSEREHQIDMENLRSKYETMIGKDRAINELRTNQLVQRYEDQLERERTASQKDMSMRLSESQAQFERLFKQSELEKETLRNQFEQRIENMKNTSLSQGIQKKHS